VLADILGAGDAFFERYAELDAEFVGLKRGLG
jgi:hypothetical protein